MPSETEFYFKFEMPFGTSRTTGNFTGMRLDDRDKITPADIKFTDIESHLFNSSYFEESDPFIEEIKKTGKEIKLLAM